MMFYYKEHIFRREDIIDPFFSRLVSSHLLLYLSAYCKEIVTYREESREFHFGT